MCTPLATRAGSWRQSHVATKHGNIRSYTQIFTLLTTIQSNPYILAMLGYSRPGIVGEAPYIVTEGMLAYCVQCGEY